MKGFDLYRITMAYLGVIFVMCAAVVFDPLGRLWPTGGTVAVQDVATPVIAAADRGEATTSPPVLAAPAVPDGDWHPVPRDPALQVPKTDLASQAPTDPAEVVANLVAESFGAQFGEVLGEGDITGQTDADLNPADALVTAGSDVAYTIAPGDSLGSLALRFYGDSTLASVIFEANRGLMKSADQLRVGQVVIIPGRS